MKNKKLIICLSVILLVVIAIVCYLKIKNSSLKNEDVVATSKYGVVTVGDVKAYIGSLNNSFRQNFDFEKITDEEKELIIKEIINNRVIYQKARNLGIMTTQEYRDRVANFQINVAKEIYLNRIAGGDKITESQIKERYEKIKENLKDKTEYKVKHIVVKTKGEIEDVVKQLKTKPFATVAEKYSIDVSKNNGGDLGYIIEGQTVPEFEAIVKEIKLNTLSNPFQTKFGWHVLIKEDERPATVPSYEDSKNTVKEILMREIIKEDSDKNLKDSELKISVIK